MYVPTTGVVIEDVRAYLYSALNGTDHRCVIGDVCVCSEHDVCGTFVDEDGSEIHISTTRERHTFMQESRIALSTNYHVCDVCGSSSVTHMDDGGMYCVRHATAANSTEIMLDGYEPRDVRWGLRCS